MVLCKNVILSVSSLTFMCCMNVNDCQNFSKVLWKVLRYPLWPWSKGVSPWTHRSMEIDPMDYVHGVGPLDLKVQGSRPKGPFEGPLGLRTPFQGVHIDENWPNFHQFSMKIWLKIFIDSKNFWRKFLHWLLLLIWKIEIDQFNHHMSIMVSPIWPKKQARVPQ